MCDSLLDAFSERTLSLTCVDAVLKYTAPPPPSKHHHQQRQDDENLTSLFSNEPSALFGGSLPSGKRKEVAADDAPTTSSLLELFATVVEVQSAPTLLLPRYQLLVADVSTLRPALVHFWCGALEQKILFFDFLFLRLFFFRLARRDVNPHQFTPGAMFRFIGKMSGQGVFLAHVYKPNADARQRAAVAALQPAAAPLTSSSSSTSTTSSTASTQQQPLPLPLFSQMPLIPPQFVPRLGPRPLQQRR